MAARANRLIHETSPYLRQHAHNPVDWYPWGPEALEKARAEQKPIFLSIGYSACHWCHVMERESFEDQEIAAILNERFVPVKVDREERPDLDLVYQRAAQLAGVAGGWPLSVFLTPDLKPFWVGTYLPPDDRYGRPGFRRVLRAIDTTFLQQRARVEEVAERLAAAVAVSDYTRPGPAGGQGEARGGEEGGAEEPVRRAVRQLLPYLDPEWGGLGDAPKFPNPVLLELLLHGACRGEEGAGGAFLLALRRMAEGGVYDQLGGGFHRYAVDRAWQIPHFEKMLYDNALLAPLYALAFRLSGEPRFAAVARGTCDYVLRDLSDGELFFTSRDADSAGEEGLYYVWTPAEVEAAAGDDAPLLMFHLGVTPEGNFSAGRSVLRLAAGPEEVAGRFGLTVAEAERRLARGRRALLEARQRRVPPGRDEKVITGWNGLMIAALARVGFLLDEPRFLAAAGRAADALLARHRDPAGGLVRTWRGERPVPAFLDDYAYLTWGLIHLYQASFHRPYLEAALTLAWEALERYGGPAPEGGWDLFYTPAGAEAPLDRPRAAHDEAVPSPTGQMARNLLLLAALAGDDTGGALQERAFQLVDRYAARCSADPFSGASLVLARHLAGEGPLEVTLAGGSSPAELAPWLQAVREAPAPALLLRREEAGEAPGGAVPVTARVCRRFTCSLPLASPQALKEELSAGCITFQT